MREEWQKKKLGDICDFEKVQGIHQGLPYVGLEDIESQTARFMGTVEPQSVKSATFRFSQEHVLYGRLRPYLNKAFAPNFEGHCSTEIFPLKPRPELSRDFLLYWLLADATCERINATCTGARMPRAQMNDVLRFEFFLPPLPEQRRIVGILDEAFAGLATAEANAARNLQNAREIFDSHLHAVFSQSRDGRVEHHPEAAALRKGWVRHRLSEVTKKIGSGATPQGGEANYKQSGISLIRSLNVHDCEFRLKDLAFIDGTQARQLDNVSVEQGDVLLNITGASVARCCIVPNDLLPARVNQHVSILRPIAHQLSPRFLQYLLVSGDYKNRLLSAGDGGATRQALTKAQLQDFEIELPPLPEQQGIVEELDELRLQTGKLCDVAQQKQSALAELKKSLLHAAFNGDL